MDWTESPPTLCTVIERIVDMVDESLYQQQSPPHPHKVDNMAAALDMLTDATSNDGDTTT